MDISAEEQIRLQQASDLSERILQIRGRIEAAASNAGRSSNAVRLIAVTKKHPVSTIQAAITAGLLDIGENYVLEAIEKKQQIPRADCRWHMLGHLQTNKAQAAVETFDLIQSVDSVRLARQIGKYARTAERPQKILLQVHLGDEATKFGLPPDTVPDAVQEVQEIPGIKVCGLMGIAPQREEPRPYFRLLRHLYEALPSSAQSILSMGMTNDFEAAVEEGSTMVRIGTALFGQRNA